MTFNPQRAAATRTLVAYLAEQHAGWLSSQFFGARAAAFLSPVFVRTLFQAQCNGATAAAARLHDEAIGVGRAFHLFRLPEMQEEGIAAALGDAAFAAGLKQHLASPDAALAQLATLATPCEAGDGARLVEGDLVDAADAVFQTMAGLYLDAFQRGIKTFPFVREA